MDMNFWGVWLLPIIDTVNIWTCFYFPIMGDLQHLCLHALLNERQKTCETSWEVTKNLCFLKEIRFFFGMHAERRCTVKSKPLIYTWQIPSAVRSSNNFYSNLYQRRLVPESPSIYTERFCRKFLHRQECSS